MKAVYIEQTGGPEVMRLGQATFLKGLDCLKPRGMMVHFGVSSRQIEPFDTRELTTRGSLFLARPTLNTHI